VIQATEVIKLILDVGTPLIGRLLRFDALGMRTNELSLTKDPDCPICGTHPVIRELSRGSGYHDSCGIPIQPSTEIAATELKVMLSDPSKRLTLLDVRDPHEWDICRIEGAMHIPANLLSERMHEVDASANVIVYCLSGGRSHTAAALLRQAGFKNVQNLSGGIRAWANSVESAMPIY
jgi:adenylyltransferase/sulfurtransferase